MNKTWTTKLLLILFVLLISACKDNESFIIVSDLKGNQLAKITDTATLQSIAEKWSSKSKVMVKQTPDFDWIVSYTTDSGTEEWKYAKTGFAQLNNSKSGDIYRVTLEELIKAIDKN